MVRIRYLRKFLKAVNKLSSVHQQQLFKKVKIFRVDPNDPQLKTHKLNGKLMNQYAFSVNYSVRVLFEYVSEEEVTFLDVGTHEVYK